MPAADKHNGFSLIETVAAVTILSLLSGGALEIFYQGFKAKEASYRGAIASNLAREKLEAYSVWPVPAGATENYGTIAGYPDFKREVTVSNYGSYASSDLQQITVTVYWNNDAKRQTFTTFKAGY